LELRSQLDIIRRRGLLIVISVIVAVAVAVVLKSVVPPTYPARATLLIGNAPGSANPTLDQVLLSQRISVTYADLATQRATLDRVIQRLKLDIKAEDLAKDVSADAPEDSSIVRITVEDNDAGRGAAIANAIADDVIQSTRQLTGRDPSLNAFMQQTLSETQMEIETVRRQIADLASKPKLTPEEEAQLSQLQAQMVSLQSTFGTFLAMASSAASNLATLSDPAVAALEPAGPSPVVNVLLAALAGLLVGVGLAFVRDHLDDSVRDDVEVQRLSGYRTIGSIGTMQVDDHQPRMYWLETLLRPQTSVAESFRTLRTNLDFAAVDDELRSILITSARAGDGKTTVAANLAIVFAQSGRRTILVDADFRRPLVHELFRLPPTPGLTNARPWTKPALDRLLVATEEPNLRVLRCGVTPPNPLELVGSQWMGQVFAALKETGDLIIFDSPPLDLVSDAAVIATKVDATILVVKPRHTTRSAVGRAVALLRQADARVVGVVLNQTGRPKGDAYSSYYYVSPEVAATKAAPTDAAARSNSR
jgi:non-specific protein-tyrosine kinase